LHCLIVSGVTNQLGALVHIKTGGPPEKRKITSVWETIRKDPLVEAQTRNTFGGMRIGLSVKNSVEKSFPTQTFTEIGLLAAELWPQTIFNMAAVCHLEF